VAPAIEVTGLSFSYPDGHQALDGVDLTVEQGEKLAIIGANGAGKTTLLLHFNGLLRGQGRIRVLGREVTPGNLRWIRSRVGLVFQDPDDQLFSPTVLDDIAFGPLNLGCSPTEAKERVARALEWVGLQGYESRSPHRLSLGEKKRVALATVLAMDPEILVLDEPTANLDPAARGRLTELLEGWQGTLILATHDLETVGALCRRVAVMDGGRIVAEGAVSSILSDEELLLSHGLAYRGRCRSKF